MARLFVFAIGGTGTRVLKSLTMLLAAGVKPRTGNFEIVPIIIDPHKASDAMKKTVQLMESYQKIASEAKCKNGFFGTTISTLDNIIASENKLADNFIFDLQEISNTKFRDYIDFNQLDEANQALADVLFSGTSINKRHEKISLLDVEMDIGFVGNPNIGSVVLNQFKDSDEFREFANNFNNGDRIFIVSSIFGGTGAAGFPTILKNIRGAKNIKNITGQGYLENAPIGAITVLPYFNLEADDNSPIQRAEFISKTRSALYYYRDNVSGNNSVNALYYIGDDYSGKPYKNDPGDGGQPNDAHFIELAAALSIIDFLEIPDNDLSCNNGKALRPIYKEFSIRSNADPIHFSDLQEYVDKKIRLRLSQLALFKKFVDEQLIHSAGKTAWSTDIPEINNAFLESSFFRNTLIGFLNSYGIWLKELSNNKRAFSPINMEGALDTFITDKKLTTGFLGAKKISFSIINEQLNKDSKGINFASSQEKFLELFFETTEKILREKYGF